MLDNLGLPCVPMLTGGKSFHVIVPLQPKATGETVKLFTRTVAVRRSEAAPDRYIATMSKARRKGLICIDWRRSNRGGTAVAESRGGTDAMLKSSPKGRGITRQRSP